MSSSLLPSPGSNADDDEKPSAVVPPVGTDSSPPIINNSNNDERLQWQKEKLELQLELERQRVVNLQLLLDQQQQQQHPAAHPWSWSWPWSWSFSKRQRIGMAVVLMILVLGGAVAGIVCGTGHCDPNYCVPRDSAPKRPPRPTADAEAIHSYINNITLSGRTLQYPSSATAEERALQWLIDADQTISLPPESNDSLVLQQRYTLATLWFQSPYCSPMHAPSWTWTSIPECSWYNVVCDGCTERVTALDVPYFNVQGRIPEDFGLLTAMTHLNLWANRLTGTIPSSLGLLTDMESLSLLDNKLTGTIPSSLGSMTALTYLHLSGNKLTGTIPSWLGSFTALSVLDLSDNALSGTIPSSLASLPMPTIENDDDGIARFPYRNHGFYDLFLHGNALTGTIPSSLVKLTALGYLHVHNNQLNGTMPFCNTNQTFESLVADCDKVSCPCCTHCCPTAWDGIPAYGGCDVMTT
jgi:hypothetical protein